MAYDWIKAFHVIAVIAWMAGLLYLPRLFVYHVDAAPGSDQSETFKLMERRLFRTIMTPAMIATWIFGLVLVVVYGVGWSDGTGWLHAKLVAVVLLTAVHGYLGRFVKSFAADVNARTQRFFRVLNEVPTVLMIAVVILVIVKPF